MGTNGTFLVSILYAPSDLIVNAKLNFCWLHLWPEQISLHCKETVVLTDAVQNGFETPSVHGYVAPF
jgi:hypothetical protein